jgi:hypothetical protein
MRGRKARPESRATVIRASLAEWKQTPAEIEPVSWKLSE